MQIEFERLCLQLREDSRLRETILGDGAVEGVIARARAAGFALTLEECARLGAASSTLSDSTLDQIVGGLVFGKADGQKPDSLPVVGNGFFNDQDPSTVT